MTRIIHNGRNSSPSPRSFDPLRMLLLVLSSTRIGKFLLVVIPALGILLPLLLAARNVITAEEGSNGSSGIIFDGIETGFTGYNHAVRGKKPPPNSSPTDTITKSEAAPPPLADTLAELNPHNIDTPDADAPAKLIPAPQRTYHIFQVAPQHTGSTLLNNILIGLFEGGNQQNVGFMHGYDYIEHVPPLPRQAAKAVYDEPQIIDSRQHPDGTKHHSSPINATVVTKTHLVRIDRQISIFENKFDRLFFVVAQRGVNRIAGRYCDERADSKYRGMVLCLEYDEFKGRTREEMVKSVATVRRRIQESLPYFSRIRFDEVATVERLVAMSKTMEKMKNEPFEVYEAKFGVHGGHTGREKNEKEKELEARAAAAADKNSGGKLKGGVFAMNRQRLTVKASA